MTDTELEEITIVEIPANGIIYSQDKATIDTMIATAKAYPRDIMRCVNNAIAIVTMDRETAESMNYAIPRAGKFIGGPSVHLAKVLAQCFGNLRVEMKTVSVDETTVTSQGVAFDLESNYAVKTDVKRSIMTRSGRMSDDMIVVTGNAANSIAFRNSVFAVIPKAITDKVNGAAKTKVVGDVSTPELLAERRNKIFDRLKSLYKIADSDILFAIGKKTIDRVDKDDLVAIVGIGQAIKDGDTTVEQVFKYAAKRQETAYKAVPKADESGNKDLDKPAIIKKIKSKADLVRAYGMGYLSSTKYNELLSAYAKPVVMP
jgi:predicted flap endonuclease-1-like 5' DNA nuclease